ncbi:hypothetical protein [Pedobacter mendelii]|uniref:DUF304 domain-containing protein n=1 Tax=Pedobacter mendelii TaxID=1908240 RepID=A0ABQ2BN38_9SPHI|nr:hypothetical protein [Pedobacter mendelii]GGI28575.1 hypothetical protein GCM10008119_33330 [Pedobacter mendelii]
MRITKTPLLKSDMQLLNRAYRIRLWLGILFILPITLATTAVAYLIIQELRSEQITTLVVCGSIFVFIIIYLLKRFVIPFYLNSYKNLSSKEKIIVETNIINIESRVTSRGIKFIVDTEYRFIDSWSVSILKTELNYNEMFQGMSIKIHCLENNKIDILYITR